MTFQEATEESVEQFWYLHSEQNMKKYFDCAKRKELSVALKKYNFFTSLNLHKFVTKRIRFTIHENS